MAQLLLLLRMNRLQALEHSTTHVSLPMHQLTFSLQAAPSGTGWSAQQDCRLLCLAGPERPPPAHSWPLQRLHRSTWGSSYTCKQSKRLSDTRACCAAATLRPLNAAGCRPATLQQQESSSTRCKTLLQRQGHISCRLQVITPGSRQAYCLQEIAAYCLQEIAA